MHLAERPEDGLVPHYWPKAPGPPARPRRSVGERVCELGKLADINGGTQSECVQCRASAVRDTGESSGGGW
jgi:hypothetical protein